MGRHATRTKKGLEEYNENPNICQNCGSQIPVLSTMSVKETLAKKFCSLKCCNKYNNQPRIRGACIECLGPIQKQRKLFCSIECRNTHTRRASIEKTLNSDAPGRTGSGPFRSYIFEKFGEKCCKCGWGETNQTSKKKPLVINHIDGNSSNNSEDNIELLCPNCDSLTQHIKD